MKTFCLGLCVGLCLGALLVFDLYSGRPKVVLLSEPTAPYTSWACYLSAPDSEMRCADLSRTLEKIAKELDKGTESI